MIKKIQSLMLAVVLVAGLTACSGSTGTDSQAVQVKIRFATQALKEGGVMEQILNEYKDVYPNVTIELEEAPGNDLITKINTDIMANNCPDVFTYWRPEKKWDFDRYISVERLQI